MKSFFLSRQSREKILLLGLVIMATLWWLTSALNRGTTFIADWKNTTDTLKSQQRMLDARETIQARAAAAIQQLDPASTFDTLHLQAELGIMTDAAGIANKTISDARSERTAQFSVNSAQIQIRNTDYPSLVKFYDELKKRTPYIGLDQMSIQPANPANPVLLIMVAKVSSVEIAR